MTVQHRPVMSLNSKTVEPSHVERKPFFLQVSGQTRSKLTSGLRNGKELSVVSQFVCCIAQQNMKLSLLSFANVVIFAKVLVIVDD